MKKIDVKILIHDLGLLSGTVEVDGTEVSIEPFKIQNGTTPRERTEALIARAEEVLAQSAQGQ